MNRMKNYRDLSSAAGDINAGFQYEFFCQSCDFTWRSQFKPYRMGQITGWLTRLTFLMSSFSKAGRTTGAFSSAGERSAKEDAFMEAQGQAHRYFTQCAECNSQACADCLDESTGVCKVCTKRQQTSRGGGHGGGYDDGQSGGALACPNCQMPSSGGRFCHECGFDMASTHKSCPGCGSVMPRAARFCTDCGHGF